MQDWNDVITYLHNNDLSREQRTELLNYFIKEINAFPIDDCVRILPTGAVLANGKVLTLEQREAFIQASRSLLSNTAFNIIADQCVYQAMKKGIHDSTHLDHLYFSKTALFFFDLFKTYLQKIGGLPTE